MIEFSPIDEVAKATILLSGTQDKYTVFHAYNGHNVSYADVIDSLNNAGLKIDTVSKWEFLKKFNEVIKDDSKNINIMSLIAYTHTGEDNRRLVKTSNTFTIRALYRLGYNWPIIDNTYLEKLVKELKGLGFFN